MIETNPQQTVREVVPPNPAVALAGPQLKLPSKKTSLDIDMSSLAVTIFAVSLIATALLYGYHYLPQTRTLNEQQSELTALQNELASPTLQQLDQQVKELSTGLDLLDPILSDQTRKAELLWTLKKITAKAVRWTALGFSAENQLSLTGEAADWGAVSRQLAAMKGDERLAQVELVSANVSTLAETTGVSFSVSADVIVEKLIPPQ